MESVGYHVISAHDGINALRMAYNESPNLIILDSNMPNIDGYEACRLLKHDSQTNQIPIVLLKNDCKKDKNGFVLDTGADEYINKDFNLLRINKVIKKVIPKNTFQKTQTQPKSNLSDVEILVRISQILDNKFLESTLSSKIAQCTNSIKNLKETIQNVFCILNSSFNYTLSGILLNEANEIYIDANEELDNEYLNWVLYKIHRNCNFDYKNIIKNILSDKQTKQPSVVWDTDGAIFIKKLFIKGKYIGAFIVTRTTSSSFSEEERDILISLTTPLATILDNARMYREVKKTNTQLKRVQQELIDFSRTLDNKIDERTHQLHKLYEAGKILTTIHEPNRLLATLVDMILSSIGAEVGAAILVEKNNISKKIEYGLDFETIKNIRLRGNNSQNLYDHVTETGQIMVLSESEIDQQLDLSRLKSRNLKISSIACIPFKTGSSLFGIMVAVNKLNDNAFSKDDIVSMKTLSSMATVAIENAMLYQQTINKAKLEADMKLANEMQIELLPKVPIQNDMFEVASTYLPAETIGGDYYDYIKIDEHNTGFVVADVTGHGVSAAFIMSLVKTCVQLLAKGILSTKKVVEQLNSFLCENIPKNNFVSMAYAIVNTKNKSILYTSAGHNPSLWYHSKTGKFSTITTDGLFLSLFEETVYGEVELHFEKNDIFLFYTDGLTEATNEKKEFFGLERIQEIISDNHEKPAKDISLFIFWELERFLLRSSMDDDMTFTVLKFKE